MLTQVKVCISPCPTSKIDTLSSQAALEYDYGHGPRLVAGPEVGPT